jgi:prepilin-type processing-associated H-X9-DG protein
MTNRLIRCVLPGAAVAAIAAVLTAAWARGFDPTAACVGNERLLIAAVKHYAADHDATLPPMISVADFDAALRPYVSNPQTFDCPETGQPYVPNAALSGKSIVSIADLSADVLFQDAVSHPDGLKTQAFLDGMVLRGGVVQGDPNVLCENNVHALVIGTEQYVQDWDGQFPPMDTPGRYRAALMPYVRDRREFICPATNTLYQPNKSLSFAPIETVPSNAIIVSDDIAHPDGIKTVGYVNGQATHGAQQPPTCETNMRRLGLALLQYAQDYDEMLPPATNISQFKSELMPYTRDASVFRCPDSSAYYVLNTSISGQSLGAFSVPSSVEVAHDPNFNADGTFNTLYLDGHVEQQMRYAPRGFAMGAVGDAYLLWRRSDSAGVVERLTSTGSSAGTVAFMPPSTQAGTLDPTSIGVVSNDAAGLIWSGYIPQLWILSPSLASTSMASYGPYDGWSLVGQGTGSNGVPRSIWTKYDGSAAVWTMAPSYSYVSDIRLHAEPGKTVAGFAVGRDNDARVLWAGSDGTAAVTIVRTNGTTSTAFYGPKAGYKAVELTIDSENHTRILWSGPNGTAILSRVSHSGILSETSITAPASYTVVDAAVGQDGDVRFLFKSLMATARLYVVKANGSVVSRTDYGPIS